MSIAIDGLQIQINSGLTFPWAFETGPTGNVSDASFGPQGVTAAEIMYIYDVDTDEALPQILGYSWRDDSTSPPTLRRILPMKHPYYNQMYCTKIVKVDGIGPEGKEDSPSGPFQTYQILALTLQFTRPPYALLEDSEIPDDPDTGTPQEWLRYTTRLWKPSVEMLSREGTTFQYSTGGTAPVGKQFAGSVGLPLAKIDLTLHWHQIPQAGIYDDDGFPNNVIFDWFNSDMILGAVNLHTFFGCEPGTLVYLCPEIIPVPLQLPPYLMQLGFTEDFLLQYDVNFHFKYFNPPTGAGETVVGWNTAPWADTFWYAVKSVQSSNPPFASRQFPNLFQIV